MSRRETAPPAPVDLPPLGVSPEGNGLRSGSAPTLGEVRALIVAAAGPGVPDPEAAAGGALDGLDLRESGAIDSLGFIELIAAIEDELDIELDFDELDPEQITTLGPLSRHVHAQAAAAGGSDAS